MKKKSEMKPELPKIYSKKMIAKYFDCSTKTVERMFQNEGLKFELVRNRPFVREEWLIEFKNKKTIKAS